MEHAVTGVGLTALLGFLGCGLLDASGIEPLRQMAHLGAGASATLAVALVLAVNAPRWLARARTFMRR